VAAKSKPLLNSGSRLEMYQVVAAGSRLFYARRAAAKKARVKN
jgi:hypothetical protein